MSIRRTIFAACHVACAVPRCDHEHRTFRSDAQMTEVTAATQLIGIIVGLPTTLPGAATASTHPEANEHEPNAFELGEGNRLSMSFNCNGMPAFGRRLNQSQVWQPSPAGEGRMWTAHGNAGGDGELPQIVEVTLQPGNRT